jgi:hypothetical protein
MNKRQLTVYMTEEDYKSLQAAVKKEGLTMSAVAVQQLKKYIRSSK